MRARNTLTINSTTVSLKSQARMEMQRRSTHSQILLPKSNLSASVICNGRRNFLSKKDQSFDSLISTNLLSASKELDSNEWKRNRDVDGSARTINFIDKATKTNDRPTTTVKQLSKSIHQYDAFGSSDKKSIRRDPKLRSINSDLQMVKNDDAYEQNSAIEQLGQKLSLSRNFISEKRRSHQITGLKIRRSIKQNQQAQMFTTATSNLNNLLEVDRVVDVARDAPVNNLKHNTSHQDSSEQTPT